jgi:hypothetical protein
MSLFYEIQNHEKRIRNKNYGHLRVRDSDPLRALDLTIHDRTSPFACRICFYTYLEEDPNTGNAIRVVKVRFKEVQGKAFSALVFGKEARLKTEKVAQELELLPHARLPPSALELSGGTNYYNYYFKNWFNTDQRSNYKSNTTAAYTHRLVFRDLEYRRDLTTSRYTVELTRQLVVHKSMRDYLLWVDRVWLNLKRSPDSHLFFLFVNVWVRDYLRRSVENHPPEYIDDYIKGLEKGFLRKCKPVSHRARFFAVCAHYESLAYFRERQIALKTSFFPQDLFERYLDKVRARVDTLRRLDSDDPIITEASPCNCHLYQRFRRITSTD